MKTRPIIFSGSMVRALLDGRKTQTRRVLKLRSGLEEKQFTGELVNYYGDHRLGMAFEGTTLVQPVGFAPGDLLYVRENWGINDYRYIRPSPIPKDRPADLESDAVVYFATEDDAEICNEMPRCPSIHMPRWASRLTLEVTDVRIQRLQAISEADAEAEGIEDCKSGGLAPLWRVYGPPPKPAFGMIGNLSNNRGQFATDARDSFSTLWDSIYEARGDGWSSNPWVAALTFSVVRRNVDEVAS